MLDPDGEAADMTRAIDKNATFMGERLLKARDVLREFAHGKRDPIEIGELATIKLDGRVVAAMIEEMKRRKLIVPASDDDEPEIGIRNFTDWRLTDAGQAFRTATGNKRVPVAKGRQVLEDLLARCEALNADPEQPMHADEVWLYGSMLGDGPEVGDVDVVVTWRFSPKYAAMERGAAFDAAADFAWDKVPASHLSSFDGRLWAAHTLFDRTVYGARRHPLLSAKQASLDTLKRLGCPCRRVFAAEKGGRVTEPTLDRHPDSKGRDPGMKEKLVMPDLHAAVKAPRGPVSLDDLDRFQHRLDSPLRLTSRLPGRADRHGWEWLTRHDGGRIPHWQDRVSTEATAARLTGCADIYLAVAPRHGAETNQVIGGIGLRREMAEADGVTEISVRFEVEASAPLPITAGNMMADLVLFAAATDFAYAKRSRENEGESAPRIRLSVQGIGQSPATRQIVRLVREATQTFPDWVEQKQILSQREQLEARYAARPPSSPHRRGRHRTAMPGRQPSSPNSGPISSRRVPLGMRECDTGIGLMSAERPGRLWYDPRPRG